MRKSIRVLVAIFASALFGAATVAQQPIKAYRIGFLGPASQLDVFRNALADLGYVEGKNTTIDGRWPDGEQLDQLSTIAVGFVGNKVDVIVAIGATAARSAKATTNQIPIVFAGVVNPVATGLVTNLVQPDGNLTGATTFDPEQARQQVELLKEAIPGLARVAVLGDSGAAPTQFQVNEQAARAAGLETLVLKVERGAVIPDFEGAFEKAKKEGAQAVIVMSTPVTTPHRRRIAESSIKTGIPTLSPRDHADAGGMLNFGTAFSGATRRAAVYVAKIFEGAKPNELPIEMVHRHELVINYKTAREIGLTLPAAFVARTHQAIE